MRAVDSWIHTGLTRADRLHAHAHTLLALWDNWSLKFDLRRRLLRLTHQFFVNSSNAFHILDSLETRLHSFSSNSLRSSDDLQRELNQINDQLIQSTEIPLRQGHILLEKAQLNNYNSSTIREHVRTLEQRLDYLRKRLNDEYEKLDRQGSSLYQTFDQQYSSIQSWLTNILEQFLLKNRFLIDFNHSTDANQQARDFNESHQQIIEHDLKVRNKRQCLSLTDQQLSKCA